MIFQDVSTSSLQEVETLLRGPKDSLVNVKFLEMREIRLTMERCVKIEVIEALDSVEAEPCCRIHILLASYGKEGRRGWSSAEYPQVVQQQLNIIACFLLST